MRRAPAWRGAATNVRSCLHRSGGRAVVDVGRAGEGSHMLVLTRKSNQSIMIGDEIEVTVLAVMGEKVRIGIDAPRSVPVFRKEVYLEIEQERADERTGDAKSREEVERELGRLKS